MKILSEIQLSSGEIEKWLEEETHAILMPFQAEAKKLSAELNTALNSEIEVSKMLLENSAKEIERRNMRVYNRARALNKLAHLFLDRLKKVIAPEQVSYDSLNKFAQDTQKVFMVVDIDVKNWFPRVSPFFIMDRRKFLTVHEKAKITLGTANDFLTKEYVKTKTLEETFGLIKELHAREKQEEDLKAQIENLKNERIPLEQKIAELEAQISKLKREGPIDQLILIESETETLNTELRYALRHLQKPFLKTQALAHQGGGSGLTQDELKTLNDHLEKPLEALAKEQKGYPRLKEVLEKVAELIKDDKLKLKPDKARKADQLIEEILKRDSLYEIHGLAVDMAARKNALLSSGKMGQALNDIALFQEQIGQIRARKTSIEAHEAVIERALADVKERVLGDKQTIEKNILASLNKNVQILCSSPAKSTI